MLPSEKLELAIYKFVDKLGPGAVSTAVVHLYQITGETDYGKIVERLKDLESSSRILLSKYSGGQIWPRGDSPDKTFFYVGSFLIEIAPQGRKYFEELEQRAENEWQTQAAGQDRKFARLAIDAARQSVPEKDGRLHPSVGAVVVKSGEVIAAAHRGEVEGNHAEYLALEKKLADDAVAGATVYTTLEPCTTRNHPKIPCAERLIERKVGRVVIGMLDPDPRITGRGQRRLRSANIITEFFPHDLMSEVEELNREFARQFEPSPYRGAAPQVSRPRKPEYGLLFESRPARLGVAVPAVRELRILLHNGGLNTLDKYRIDLELPQALLEHDSALYIHELHDRRSPGYRFFRIPARDQRTVNVYPEDTEQVFTVIVAISRAGVTFSGLSLQARLYVEGNAPVNYKVDAEELFAPANSAHFLNPAIS
jgi:pyrimidine deaminase RibD-like protein